jgi:adenylosuccinate lyase
MPHKRNPIRSERLCGLARLVRSMVIPALENIPTWHERDLTNSSVERVILPDASILTDYILRQFAAIVRGLVVKPENMRANLEKTQGVVFSQRVMLALVKKGWSREDAYKLVQQCAFEAIQQGRPFRSILESRPEIRETLSPSELDELFDYGYFIRHVDEIFRRFGL